MRKFILFVVDSWRLVMNAKYNPLRFIPDPSLQTYFMLVLFTMWSVYFGFLASYYMGWLGYNTVLSIIIHIAVLVPLAFTNAIFLDAERDGHKWYVNLKSDTERKRFWNKISKPNYEKRAKWNLDKEA